VNLSIRPYERQQHDAVLDLLFYARRQHTHLDWYRVSSFLDLPDTLIYTAWENNTIVGVLGVSAPLDGTTWVRIAATDNAVDAQPVLDALWEVLRDKCRAHRIYLVGFLAINRWVLNHLPLMDFAYDEDVVTLGRVGDELPILQPHPFVIQNAYLDVLPELVAIDHTAFDAPWQMSRDEIRHAQRQAASCTVAVFEERIIGYQVSTRHQNTAHLARLAVHPEFQGRGVGAVLLHDLIRGLLRRNVRSITVNTQRSNTHSHQLYARFNFRPNGYDLPVWFWKNGFKVEG
jgi:ribosomal-protein-alanine N-acetyltransferase